MLPRNPAPLKIDPARLNYWILAGCALLMGAGLWWCWSITS